MVYLDDLLVHAGDFGLALGDLRQVFQAIRGERPASTSQEPPSNLLQRENKFLGQEKLCVGSAHPGNFTSLETRLSDFAESLA